jgi:hypothetical protein
MALAVGTAPPAAAEDGEDGEWTVAVEPVYMQVYGHDPHVLTVHELDRDGAPALDTKTLVDLESDAELAYRAEVVWDRGEWSWGLDFLIFRTPQDAADLAVAADGPGGPVEEVVFEIADDSFASSGPGEVLYYQVLEDTTIETWTLDLYAARPLAERPGTELELRLGLRNADFDNDYRAVVGIEGTTGTRLDASSNYSRMMGPLLGLAGGLQHGRHSFSGVLAQSLVIGSVELQSGSRRFVGPFVESPAFFAEESFRLEQDVAIPITDFRLDWSVRVTDLVSVGAGVTTSAWWEVPIPPGLAPVPGGDEALAETTIVFFGLSASVTLAF